jgi:hypothetical protein
MGEAQLLGALGKRKRESSDLEQFPAGDGASVKRFGTAIPCLWCGRPFVARRGGSPQRFCPPAHRMAFWSALRRLGEHAVATGVLTVDQVRNGDPAACTLLPGGISPALVSEPRKPAPVPPPECPSRVVITLDRMLDMQLRELGWGDPFHPATSEELAATAGALIRAAIPNWLMAAARGQRS